MSLDRPQYQARAIAGRADDDAMDELEERVARMVAGAVLEAVTNAMREHALTPQEREWIARAMRLQAQREERRDRLYTAVVEKSLTALLFSAAAGLIYLVVEWAKNHGYKP